MQKKVFVLLLSLVMCCMTAGAEEVKKSELELKAEAVDASKKPNTARSMFVLAFNDYANRGITQRGVECALRAVELYCKDNLWQEAFDLLRNVEQAISQNTNAKPADRAAWQYIVTKERLNMYLRLHKGDRAREMLNIMKSQVDQCDGDSLQSDFLYQRAIYFYNFGMTDKGNAIFKEMADKKVEETAKRAQKEIADLKNKISEQEATIADKDSSLTSRWAVIILLGVVAVALAAALVIGALVLMRYILLSRKQKKTIREANESNAQKAKFISNISAQLEPTLRKLDSKVPEVKALLEFSSHVETLSNLENGDEEIEMEEVGVQPFCESLMEAVRTQVNTDVTLTVNAPKMTVKMNKEYVSHILAHLLLNAAQYTPAGGHIWLDYKKRGARTHQFMVSDTGGGIAEEQRDGLFTPFREVHDLTKGDGLGLPICKQMARRMNGDLDLDISFTKGARFVLELHS